MELQKWGMLQKIGRKLNRATEREEGIAA